jgi:ubiquinol-cytochrome c reductase cytochrome c1 subunit
MLTKLTSTHKSIRFTNKKFKKNFNQRSSYSKNYKNDIPLTSGYEKKFLLAASVAVGMGALIFLNSEEADASAEYLHGYNFPWHHYHFWGSYDHAAIRRGFRVFMQVGAACHSLKYIQYRHLVGVCLTEEEARELAAESEFQDGPDDEGEMFDRPGVLLDGLKAPYRNEMEARYMNNGALPPDLSVVVKARHNEENYVFNLLTGYRDPPAGFILGENMYYNPYFPGAQIAMPPPLQNDMVEYEDGTDASISQMAKDVTTFLAWTGSPELDERHLLGVKALGLFGFMAATTLYWKRFIWAPVKARQVRFLRQTENALKKRTRNF